MLDSQLLISLLLTTPTRLDQALLEALKRDSPTLSRAKLKDAIRAGHVLYLARPAEASCILPIGPHEITLQGWSPSANEASLQARAAAHCFLPIAYEDEDLLILNKRSGIPSVPHEAQEIQTAVSAALAHHPGLRDIGRGGLEPGLLHRLDTGTSGLLAFAKSQAEFERLIGAWRSKNVRKIYRALAAPLKTPQTLRLEMGHDAKSSKRMRVLDPSKRIEIRGKSAQTITHLVNSLPVRLVSLEGLTGLGDLADLEIEIETGAMHQIRCTLSHLGSPIVGDPIYGGPKADRLWLHAWRLLLPLKSGAPLWVEAPLPEGWPSVR